MTSQYFPQLPPQQHIPSLLLPTFIVPHIWKDKAPHLGDVDLGTFSSRHNHRLKVVVFRQGFLSRGASLVSGIIENAVHLVFKCLPQSVPWGGL